MSYEEWKHEQTERAKAERAGIEFKTRREILAEAAGMKRVLSETSFK